jgi:hypothetical protein
MLFGRKIPTKLPELCHLDATCTKIRDRDMEKKEKGKMYTDARRNAQESDLQEGDLVLMKQKKIDKLSTNFSPSPMKIVSKGGNGVLVESPEGVRYRRNVTNLRKFIGERPSPTNGNFEENQSMSMQNENVSNNRASENVSNENVSMSNQCVYNQNVSESSACDSYVDTSNSLDDSGKIQSSSRSMETTVHTRPVRKRKMPIKFQDYELN